MDKQRIREEIIRLLEAERANLAAGAEMARAEATDSESAGRSKYDTRAQEAAYLAGSQAKLALELGESIGIYRTMELRTFNPTEAVTVGALVELESRASRSLYFIGPRKGGLELAVDGNTILALSPQSPLGGRLMGKKTGATLEISGELAPQRQTVRAIS